MAVFPHTGTFESSLSFEAIGAVALQYGKGTVTTRIKNSTNPIRNQWSVSFNIHGEAKYQEINSFLKSRNGIEPFEFKYSPVTYNYLYRCEQWDWTHNAGDIYSFRGTFIEVRRLVK